MTRALEASYLPRLELQLSRSAPAHPTVELAAPTAGPVAQVRAKVLAVPICGA